MVETKSQIGSHGTQQKSNMCGRFLLSPKHE